ncbi:MAG: hypothetical protein DLM69_08355 [Candidatus Chloroheliales bacterium]|nr:MAG: hypothetical protein DLM69_08355 [Chloroflexota bacterium]
MIEQRQEATDHRDAAPRLGKADLHMHTTLSDGIHTVEKVLEYVQQETDLDIIAVTDHDNFKGGLLAREIAARRNYRFEVVLGAEITTRQGHLLCYFFDDSGYRGNYKMYKPVEEVVHDVLDAGGLCVAPHALSWLTLSLGEGSINKLFELKLPLSAIETMNPSIAARVSNKKVREMNRAVWHLPEVGNSDSHAAHLVGSSYTAFAGNTAADLEQAMRDGTTAAMGEFWSVRQHTDIAAANLVRSWLLLPASHVRRGVNNMLGRGEEQEQRR